MAKPKIETKEESISPTKAHAYLKTMVANRKLTDQRVVDYAVEMDEDKWVVNGESLKFNELGQLIDGQHRLQACILAGKPFKTLVTYNISDDKAFATIDVGKTRSVGDIFSIAGIADCNNMSGATNIIYLYRKHELTANGPRGMSQLGRIKKLVAKTQFASAPTARGPSRETLLSYAQNELGIEKLHESLRVARACGAAKIMPISQLTACHYLFTEVGGEEQATKFLIDLGKGENLRSGDAVLTLRERLISSRTTAFKLTRWGQLLLTFKAWNKRRTNDPSKQTKIWDGEIYPKLV